MSGEPALRGGTEAVGERPLFLHFLNRELTRAVGTSLTPEFCARHVLLAATTTDVALTASLAFVWESGVLEAPSGSAIAALLESGGLLLVSEFVTLDEFLASAQRLYRHDLARYPMYFRDSPGALEIARPHLAKTASTTSYLVDEIETLLGGDASGVQELVRGDLRAVMRRREVMETAMAAREQRAVTLSLFQSQAAVPGGLAVGRMLSMLHLKHYLNFTGADIMTGIDGVSYFDVVSRAFPRCDAWYATTVLASIGFDAMIARRDWDDVLVARGSADHRVFQELLSALIHGLEHRVGVAGLHGLAGRQLARRLLMEWAAGPADALPAADLYRAGAARLSRIVMEGNRRDGDFRRYQELRRAGGRTMPSRVLILVATETERNAVIEAAARSGGGALRRTFLPYHTLFHLGLIGGAEVLLAQGEQGTESPGAMALTAGELIDHCAPDYLILAGIAYGLREKEQRTADVLVSTQLRLVDPRKVTQRDGGPVILARGDKVSSSVTLLDRFRGASADWTGCRVHFGLMLSGNVLINATSLRDELARSEPDALGGEMEGAGLYCVGAKRKVDWIVVKGISDWGHDKTDGHQPEAAANSATYVMHVLRTGGLARSAGA